MNKECKVAEGFMGLMSCLTQLRAFRGQMPTEDSRKGVIAEQWASFFSSSLLILCDQYPCLATQSEFYPSLLFAISLSLSLSLSLPLSSQLLRILGRKSAIWDAASDLDDFVQVIVISELNLVMLESKNIL